MTDQEKIAALEAENALYKKPGGIGLYYELNRIVNETVLLSRETPLKSMLSLDPKEDKTFERMQILIKNAKDHVIEMNDIKAKLGLTGDQETDESNLPFIERIATKRD